MPHLQSAPVVPDVAPTSPYRQTIPNHRHELVALVQELIPDSSADSPVFRSVMVIVASRRGGQNIDRLARLTGLDRDFVARCVRRLVDNGVWVGGAGEVTVHSDAEAILTGAAVARGELCRYPDGQRGEARWVAPGTWRDLLAATPPLEEPRLPADDDFHEAPGAPSGEPPAGASSGFEGVFLAGMSSVTGFLETSRAAGTMVITGAIPAGPVDLFPGTCWLS